MSATPLLAYWVHDLSPFLVRFGENFGIRYYGLAYLLGFGATWLLIRAYHRAGRTPLDSAGALDLVMALVVGVLVGGRLGSYLLYDGWRTFSEDPLGIFKIWQGGMASHGGFLGVLVALLWFARSRRLSFRHLADIACSTSPAGLFFGRIANFINGELWGRHAEVPWAVIFENTGGGPLPRHPSQLYQAALEGALLLAYLQWRVWRTDLLVRRPGHVAGEFLIGYAIMRMIGEIFREPDASLILGLSRGTFYSLFMVAGGVALILAARGASQSRGPAKV